MPNIRILKQIQRVDRAIAKAENRQMKVLSVSMTSDRFRTIQKYCTDCHISMDTFLTASALHQVYEQTKHKNRTITCLSNSDFLSKVAEEGLTVREVK